MSPSKRQVFLFGWPALMCGLLVFGSLGYVGIYFTSQAVQAGAISEPWIGVTKWFWQTYSDYLPLVFAMAMGAWMVKSVEWVREGEV